MEGTSSFAQMEGTAPTGWRGLATSCFAALEGAAASVPLSLGCAALVFSRISPELVASGVFATMLGLAWIHLVCAGSKRPVAFAARIFEATTLAAMMEQLIPHLVGWGLADSVGVRLAFLCAISGGAGLSVGVLYLLRAQRLTPFIPAPVFAGFSNSIAVALVVSQSASLWRLASGLPQGVAAVFCTAVVAFAVGYCVRRWLPGRPATAAGLVAGLLAGVGWSLWGHPLAVVGGAGALLPLPVAQADFRALLAPGVQVWPVVLLIVGNSAILGSMVFINTAMSAQAMSQFDGMRAGRTGDGLLTGAAMMTSGLAGATVISGSIMACLAMARISAIRAATMLLAAVVVTIVYFTGVLGAMPLAAVVGVLFCEAWFLVDRPSLRLAGDWLRGRRLPDNAREDLALIASVTALAVVANMVVAAFGGLVLGLFLFAVRSAREPVRHVWTGAQLSSNCARGTSELKVLAAHGAELRVFELEGDMFFAVGASLDRLLHEKSEGAKCLVVDWARVRHIDSSVATTVATFERQAAQQGVYLVHADAAEVPHGNVADELRRRLPQGHFAANLDYALELAENQLIRRHGSNLPSDISTVFDSVSLFNGFSAEERGILEETMSQKLFKPGQVILAAGESSQELMLILQGCASIVVLNEQRQPVRLAGVRRGGIIGEVGFLDGSPRSASVIAQDDVVVATLARQDYDRLCETTQTLIPKLVANIAVALAGRLRHTNQLALARSRTH